MVSTPLKNISQLGWLFPVYGKIKVMFQTTNQFTIVHATLAKKKSMNFPHRSPSGFHPGAVQRFWAPLQGRSWAGPLHPIPGERSGAQKYLEKWFETCGLPYVYGNSPMRGYKWYSSCYWRSGNHLNPDQTWQWKLPYKNGEITDKWSMFHCHVWLPEGILH